MILGAPLLTRPSASTMAEDTQGGDAASMKSPTNKPKHELPQTQVGKLWEAFGNPDERINVHPGASYNPTHTPKPKDITISESLKTIKLEDFSTFHKKPCARDSLLLGLGAGFGIGGIRGIVGGKIVLLQSLVDGYV